MTRLFANTSLLFLFLFPATVFATAHSGKGGGICRERAVLTEDALASFIISPYSFFNIR